MVVPKDEVLVEFVEPLTASENEPVQIFEEHSSITCCARSRLMQPDPNNWSCLSKAQTSATFALPRLPAMQHSSISSKQLSNIAHSGKLESWMQSCWAPKSCNCRSRLNANCVTTLPASQLLAASDQCGATSDW